MTSLSQRKMRKVKRIYFVGIGGVGMCGIAEVLHGMNYKVSGSDISYNSNTSRLEGLGIEIYHEHKPEQIRKADVIVVSAAISKNNCELVEARKNRIPIVGRAMMLAELMRNYKSIAIAGTHGKTTTTSMLTHVFIEAKQDPTYVIGGKIMGTEANARIGSGAWMIAEADESDSSFLHLNPLLAVITNIDIDHFATYENKLEKLDASFINFLHNLPFYGIAILCSDDPGVNRIIDSVERKVITYGTTEQADYQAIDIKFTTSATIFTVKRRANSNLIITLSTLGRHNMLNALAVIAIASEENIDDTVLLTALQNFRGTKRRFEILATYETSKEPIILVDDYGHHPQEIKATLSAVRQKWPKSRCVTVFQPHRYSRTQDLYDDFVDELEKIDQLVLLDVYPAGEKPIVAADSKSLATSIRTRGTKNPIYLYDINQLEKILANLLQPGDILLTLGAGSISKIATDLSEKLNDLLAEK